MRDSRRRFLLALAGGAGCVAILVRGLFAQEPARPEPQTADPVPPRTATKALLEENQKEIKKKVEKLYELASELKKEVEKTDSAIVLSLGMVRKAEEIEKLAKEIKNRARG